MDSTSSSDEEMTLADLVSSSQGNRDESDSSSSEEEEETLASLKIKAEKSRALKAAKTKKIKAKKSAAKSKKKSDSGKKRKRASSTASRRKKTAIKSTRVGARRRIVRGQGAVLKTQLVEAVLVRWNYCEELLWPVLKDGLKETPSLPGYIELRGFKGVLVGIKNEHIGKLVDYRDQSKAPCFDNFIKKPSKTLQRLAQEAIHKQIEILEKQESIDNSEMIKNLKSELGDIMKVNPDRSDKQWKKVGWH